MALGMGNFTFRASLQSLPDRDLIFRIASRLPLLSDFARLDDDYFYHDDVPAPGESTAIFLGPVVGEDRRRSPRSDCCPSFILCRVLGQRTWPRRSLDSRFSRASVEERRQILWRFLVPALQRTKEAVRQFCQTDSLRGVQPRGATGPPGTTL